MPICIDHAIRPYFLTDYGHERFGFRVSNGHSADLTTAFQKAEDDDFARRVAAALAFARAAKITLVNFDLATKLRGAIYERNGWRNCDERPLNRLLFGSEYLLRSIP